MSRLHTLTHRTQRHSVAQGIAYIDFGFIEPAMLGAFANSAKNREVSPKSIEGQIVTRVAMGVNVLARLHHQIQRVLGQLTDAKQTKARN